MPERMVVPTTWTDEELGALAEAAKGAADRAGAAIDEAVSFVAAGNERLARREAAASCGNSDSHASAGDGP